MVSNASASTPPKKTKIDWETVFFFEFSHRKICTTASDKSICETYTRPHDDEDFVFSHSKPYSWYHFKLFSNDIATARMAKNLVSFTITEAFTCLILINFYYLLIMTLFKLMLYSFKMYHPGMLVNSCWRILQIKTRMVREKVVCLGNYLYVGWDRSFQWCTGY